MEPMRPEELFVRLEARFVESNSKFERFDKKVDEMHELLLLTYEMVCELKKSTGQLNHESKSELKILSKEMATAVDEQQTTRFLVQNMASKNPLFPGASSNCTSRCSSQLSSAKTHDQADNAHLAAVVSRMHSNRKAASSDPAHRRQLVGDYLHQRPDDGDDEDDEVQVIADVEKNGKPSNLDHNANEVYREGFGMIPTISSKLAAMGLTTAQPPQDEKPAAHKAMRSNSRVSNPRAGAKTVNRTYAGTTNYQYRNFISQLRPKLNRQPDTDSYDDDDDDDVQVTPVVPKKEDVMSATNRQSSSAKRVSMSGDSGALPASSSKLADDNNLTPSQSNNKLDNTALPVDPTVSAQFVNQIIAEANSMQSGNKGPVEDNDGNNSPVYESSDNDLENDGVAKPPVGQFDSKPVNRTFPRTSDIQREPNEKMNLTEPVYETSDSSDMDARVPAYRLTHKRFPILAYASPMPEIVIKSPEPKIASEPERPIVKPVEFPLASEPEQAIVHPSEAVSSSAEQTIPAVPAQPLRSEAEHTMAKSPKLEPVFRVQTDSFPDANDELTDLYM